MRVLCSVLWQVCRVQPFCYMATRACLLTHPPAAPARPPARPQAKTLGAIVKALKQAEKKAQDAL